MTPLRACKACVFDLYGTLVDIHTDETQPAAWRQLAGFYARNGADWTGRTLRAAYLARCARAQAALDAAAEPGAQTEIDLGEVFAALYAARGVLPTPELIAQTAWCFRQATTTHIRPYAGAASLLRALRAAGVRVYLLSNAQALFTRPELRQLGLDGLFDAVFLSSEIGRKKPDPAFFRALLTQTGMAAADCRMIGNDPTCDAMGAAAVGMEACYIRSALSPRGAPAAVETAAYSQDGMDLTKLRRVLLRAQAGEIRP